MTGVCTVNTPVNWSKDSRKHDLDPLGDKCFTEIPHKLSWLCSRENYAQKYVLNKVFTADTSLEWPKYSQKHDLDPLADKKHVI